LLGRYRTNQLTSLSVATVIFGVNFQAKKSSSVFPKLFPLLHHTRQIFFSHNKKRYRMLQVIWILKFLSNIQVSLVITQEFGSTNTKTAINSRLMCMKFHLLFAVFPISDPQVAKTANTKSENNEGRQYLN